MPRRQSRRSISVTVGLYEKLKEVCQGDSSLTMSGIVEEVIRKHLGLEEHSKTRRPNLHVYKEIEADAPKPVRPIGWTPLSKEGERELRATEKLVEGGLMPISPKVREQVASVASKMMRYAPIGTGSEVVADPGSPETKKRLGDLAKVDAASKIFTF